MYVDTKSMCKVNYSEVEKMNGLDDTNLDSI